MSWRRLFEHRTYNLYDPGEPTAINIEIFLYLLFQTISCITLFLFVRRADVFFHHPHRFFQEVRAEYKASKGSPEKYKQTFVHFMLGGEEASDIGSRRTLVKLVRMGGLLNGDRIGRAKASDAVNHPWLRNHAKGLVCDLKTKRGTMTPQQYTPFLARGLLRSAYDSAASTTSHNGATRTLLRSTYAAAVPAPPAPDPPQKQEQKKGAVVASCFGECAVQ